MPAPRKIKAQIVEIIKHDINVRTYRLKPEISLKNKFEPGQFLHLAIDEYDPSFNWPESRVFSIATSPTRAEEIDLIISQKGNYTKRIFSEIKTRDTVWIKLPYGSFNFRDSFKRKSFLIAGGTGITPFISYLQFLLDNPYPTNISLHYGVRSSGLIIIDDLLTDCVKKLNNFNLSIYLENDSVLQSSHMLIKGMISIDRIIKEAKEFENSLFYLAGPPIMIQVFKNELMRNGVKEKSILYDKWE